MEAMADAISEGLYRHRLIQLFFPMKPALAHTWVQGIRSR